MQHLHRILQALGLAALLVASHSASGFNKCTGPDGKITYTEQQCAQSHSKSTVNVSAPPPPAAAAPKSGAPRSPGQEAQCERARRTYAALQAEVALERNKHKTEMLAQARQDLANMDTLLRKHCS